jgi:hypothetical protein
MIIELVKYKADLRAKNVFKKTAYDIAVSKKLNQEIIDLLAPKIVIVDTIIRHDLEYKNSLSKRFTCPICIDGEKKVAFTCGHLTCYDCSESITECPECKAVIIKKIVLKI